MTRYFPSPLSSDAQTVCNAAVCLAGQHYLE